MYTDSMSAAYIVLRWTHGDYSPSLDQEDQDDVLDELLSVLRARTGPTTLVWVRAHAGDPGNELADGEAKAGSEQTVMKWDRPLTTVALYDNNFKA
eukprot:630358-Rhodomonas_salina.1